MSGRDVMSESVFASSVLPTPAGPSMSTGRPIRAARNTTVDTRRLAMYRASLNRCWTSSTDSNMMAPLLLSFGHCSRHFATLRPPTGRVQCHMADAARYHRLQLLLTLAGLGLSLAYLLALIVTDGGQVLARAAAGITPARWGLVALVWIVPLFYRLTPLVDVGLRDRLLTLARRAGVTAIGVFVADQSRKSRTANAAVVGLGRTRRIILFDTLLAKFSPEEIESVLAHEL